MVSVPADVLTAGPVAGHEPSPTKPPRNPSRRRAGPSTPTAERQRHRRAELPKHVRVVKGGVYQARPWVGPGKADNVNLGLFNPLDYGNDRDIAISAAARAAREFLKRVAGPPPRDPWAVIQELQSECRFGLPIVPPHVLPTWVYRLPHGAGYGAKVRRRGVRHVLPGPYQTPQEAHDAMRKRLNELEPSRIKR